MRRAERILLLAGCLLALSAGSASASFWKHGKGNAKPAEESQPAPAAAGMTLNAVEIDNSSSPRLVLRTSATPVYASYSPMPDVFIVDLSGTAKGSGLTVPTTMPSTVNSVTAEEVVEMGIRLTRVTVRLTQPMTPQANVEGNNVIVALPVPAVADAPAIAPVVAVPDAAPVAEPATKLADAPKPVTEPAVVAETLPAVKPIASAPVAMAEPAPVPANKAKTLKKIETAATSGAFEVQLAGDGAISYKAFRLENPTRLVLDLNGMNNAVAKKTIAVSDALVKQIRVAQFKGAPDPVTRVVMDLASKGDYQVIPDGPRLRVVFGDAAQLAKSAAPVAQVAEAPKPAETKIEIVPAAAPAKVEIVEVPKPQPAKTGAADLPSQVPAIADNSATWKMPARASKGAHGVITAAADQAPPATTKKSRRSRSASTPAGAATAMTPAAEDVFDQGTQPAAPAGAQNLGGQRTLSGSETQYTGEPLSLNLKDADIKDVLRTFSQLTGLNIAIDPGVTGSVTVNFTDVPWDQALDIILRQNGLTYTIEGNVMRVGTIAQIANETAARRRLDEEKRLDKTPVTVSFKLSYARAADVAGLLRDIASPRAKIIVDARTNQLIISEIPEYLQTISRLIENVDVPTRQVLIEARIVETSKTFLQQYGFSWGFRGRMDPSLGTGTGLVFPNRLDFVGGPFDFGPGNPVISMSLANVLGTFNLDLALNAAEAEGLVKVISAPRVTTQDNTAASISSGFQIPYQTRINFTTTISYVDATLRLAVTPQITEAGTVIMDIQVQKTEPATGLAIEGGAGTPLATRQASTRLMVRDGGTTVIAGIYQTRDNNAQTRLPFVHQLPVVGNLFKTHNIQTSHDELLIFITPRIVRAS